MYIGEIILKAIAILIPIIAIPTVGAYLFHKKFPNVFLTHADKWAVLNTEHRTLATMSSMKSALFGLLLGLIIVSLWNDYKDMEEKIVEEASSIDVLYSEADQINDPKSDTIKALIIKYLDSIIYDAWPLLDKGEESKTTPVIFAKLMQQVMSIKIDKDGSQEHLKKDMIERLVKLSAIRKERFYYNSNPRVPRTMWIAVAAAGIIVTFNTFLLPIADLKKRILVTMLYSSLLGIAFLLIVSLNYPFGKAIGLDPGPFERVKYNIEHVKNR